MNTSTPLTPFTQCVRAASALALLGALFACGGQQEVALKVIAPDAPVSPGPAASKEELAGEVPVLRGLPDPKPLVPPELIPPEAPADPDPGFE